jgi:hypothetical protein
MVEKRPLLGVHGMRPRRLAEPRVQHDLDALLVGVLPDQAIGLRFLGGGNEDVAIGGNGPGGGKHKQQGGDRAFGEPDATGGRRDGKRHGQSAFLGRPFRPASGSMEPKV